MYTPDGKQVDQGNPKISGTRLSGGGVLLDLSPLFQVCKDLVEALYIGAFRNAINIGADRAYFDIQVGQTFIERWRSYKTGSVKKDNEAAKRLTEDIKHIFEFRDLEINPSEDNRTLQLFINERSFKLSEVGSGLTQFVLVLANAATRQPSFVLIDEPELSLHPSLQLDFLTTLGFYAREGVLFATHSIGLARAAADWIYAVRKIEEGVSEVSELEATPRLSEFLGELSFSGYRDLGFNKVLLVEGRTDVKTAQQFLRLYGKDHQVVILRLGGSHMINESSELELNEIRRISDHVFALIDSERTAPGAPLSPSREGFVRVCERAGIQCHVLEWRTIENYFPERALKEIKGESYRVLGPYEKLSEASLGWSKEENWRIARKMTPEELGQTDLGKFLADL